MQNYEKIKTLYFSENKKQSEIAKIVGVSSQYISKVLRTIPEYYSIKAIRKDEKSLKYKANKIQAIIDRRKQIKEQENAIFGYLNLRQAQNAIEMSKRYAG